MSIDFNALIDRGYSGDNDAIAEFISGVIETAYQGDEARAESKAAAKRELHKQFNELIHQGAEAGHLECMRMLADFYRIGARIPPIKRMQSPDIVFQAQYLPAIEWYEKLLARDEVVGDERARLHAHCGGLIERTLNFAKADDYAPAIAHYEASIALNEPSSDIAHSLYGKLLVRLSRQAEAIPHLEACHTTMATACGTLWTLYKGGYGQAYRQPEHIKRVRHVFDPEHFSAP